MATINHTTNSAGDGSTVIAWADLSTADTAVKYRVPGTVGAIASIQFTGTFGGATLVLQGSNDGTNFATIKDVNGDNVSVTAAGLVDFSTGALYLRPSSSGGTGDNVDVTMVLRG